MCGEVVAAPLSLQDTVYPILRKKSLHFCENSRKFLKLCTAVRKKYKMKRLRRKIQNSYTIKRYLEQKTFGFLLFIRRTFFKIFDRQIWNGKI